MLELAAAQRRYTVVSAHDKDYAAALKTAGLDKPRGKLDKYPTFGGQYDAEKFALGEEGERVLRNILGILAFDYPLLEFCPPLPTVVALLAHHFEPVCWIGGRELLFTSLTSLTCP